MFSIKAVGVVAEAIPNHVETNVFLGLIKYGNAPERTVESLISYLKQYFFSEMRMPAVNEGLEISYYWLVGCQMATFQQLPRWVADSLDLSDLVIGSDGIVDKIDEAKLGKGKYYQGPKVDSV
ncbi:hypothetical protein HZS_6189 [Henneguya salminicola]|nr:hypothetical protein HZS_6189 [Henneguya salminicola]